MIFNWEFYINFHMDLKENSTINEKFAIYHYKTYGFKEKRIYVDIPIFFNWKLYLEYNQDLINKIHTEYEAWAHFLYNSKNENRFINNKNILNKYCI